MDRPRPLLILAVLLIGVLAAASWRPVPTIEPRDARLREGQEVLAVGFARDVVRLDGETRFTLHSHGWALPVRVPGAPAVEESASVSVEGRIGRSGGSLVLRAASEASVHARVPDAASAIAWDALARDPAGLGGRMLKVVGTLTPGYLEGEGHKARLGAGAWPDHSGSGAVEAVVMVRYEPACLCHVLDAREVRPWTP